MKLTHKYSPNSKHLCIEVKFWLKDKVLEWKATHIPIQDIVNDINEQETNPV
jgi:hypothetical protein